MTLLNGLFTRFDIAAQDLGIEKIKTVGDAYMAVCGMPVPVAKAVDAASHEVLGGSKGRKTRHASS